MMDVVPKDVLMEILLRLPPKSVAKFKCLSRRWNEIISGCFFRGRYARQIRHSSGLLALILSEKRCNRSLPRTRVAEITTAGSTTNIPKECGRFICSSNGLALCVYNPSDHPINWGGRKSKPPPTYHVVNISTKTWVALPSPTYNKGCLSMAIVCKENTAAQPRVLVTNFKVVQIILANHPSVLIETYSSSTGMWAVSYAHMRFAATPWHWHWHFYMMPGYVSVSFVRPFGPPLVLNGTIYWSVSDDYIAIYEPKDIIDRQRRNSWHLFAKPVGDKMLYSSTFTRLTDGLLWYGGVTWQSTIKFWISKRKPEWWRSPWSLRYTMNFDFLSSDCSMTSYQKECMKDYNGFYMIALSPWNPHIMLFLLRGTIFLYNMENGLMEGVQYDGPRVIDPIAIHPCFQSHLFSSKNEFEF